MAEQQPIRAQRRSNRVPQMLGWPGSRALGVALKWSALLADQACHEMPGVDFK